MAEDLEANLANYKLQLQQVEAALTTDPDSEDLLKLQKDLQEVIDLTEDLIKTQIVTSLPTVSSLTEEEPTGARHTEHAVPEVPEPESIRDWHSGDRCMAMWSEDKEWYTGVIDEILEDGTCSVTFDGYGNQDVSKVSLLRPIDESNKHGAEGGGGGSSAKKTKKDLIAQQREYKKKKAEKKRQRLKTMEEERETEKNKWLDFNAKVFSKTSKGKVKKSIFASPEAPTGRIGVGTCGHSGQPMTKYIHPDKYKKQS